MTLQEIVDQLRWCEFACEAGKLEMNTAFQELEKLAKEESDTLLSIEETEIDDGLFSAQLLYIDQQIDKKISAALDKYSL